MPRFIVIGGGVTGLAAAHRLTEIAAARGEPAEVQVLEASARPGGIVSTVNKDGYLLEEGPDCFITDKPWALDLCRRLGLSGEIIGVSPGPRRAYVVRRGALLPVPEGFRLLAPCTLKSLFDSPLLSLPGKLRAALDLFIRPRVSKDDESVGAFVRRRFGRQVLERIVQPLVTGIYSADPDRLSLRASFPKFQELEAKHGSLLRALRSRESDEAAAEGEASGARYDLFRTLRKGMGGLVSALVSRLPQGAVLVHAAVQEIRRVAGRWDVLVDTGHKLSADGLILALPAQRLAKLLRPLDSGAADILAQVPYASSGTLHLAFPWSAVQGAPEGLGFVVPAVENNSLLGCTFSSAKFPGRSPREVALLRAFIHPSRLDLEEEILVEKVRGDLAHLLRIKGDPVMAHFKRHSAAMPQYPVGHLDRVAALDWRAKIIPRLTLAGNWQRGVGLPDCVKSGEDAADLLVSKMSQPSHS